MASLVTDTHDIGFTWWMWASTVASTTGLGLQVASFVLVGWDMATEFLASNELKRQAVKDPAL